MSIVNTISVLQMLHKTIDGIESAPTVYPGSINSADLPLVIVWPGRGVTRPVTAKAQVTRTERTYSVRVFMEAVGQNTYDAPFQEGIVMLNRFLETYFNNKTLADGYTEIVSVSDSGIISGANYVATATMTYAGNFYRGFVCDITVLELTK